MSAHTPGEWERQEIERRAEAEAQMDEACGSCGVSLRDHYDRGGIWIQCSHKRGRAAIANARGDK